MFKAWLKQFLAMSICVIIILSSFIPAFADDYVESDSGDEATYYIIDGEDVNDLFDFSVWNVHNIIGWMFQFKTYTVIKKYDDTDGSTQYKCYFNTPNLQSIVKNRVVSLIGDGYTDDTYKIEDTEWVVKVGKNATDENVITKYGFSIPSYTYMGEYPKEVMSTAGILPSPKKWWEVVWRAIKSLFGVSFIKAPDADNFNTITYLNHTYKNKSDYILDFFKQYYLDYFERQIPLDYISASDSDLAGDYFSGPEEVLDLAVTKEAYDAANTYNTTHSDEYVEASQRMSYWDAYESDGLDSCLALTTTVGNKKYDAYHFLASIDKYKTQFNSWVNANPNKAYILINAALGSYRRYGGSGSYLNSARKYGLTTTAYTENTEYESSVSLAADILRYTENNDNFKAHITYDIQTRTRSVTVTITNGTAGTPSYEDWSEPSLEAKEDDVAFSETAAWRDPEEDADPYYDNYSLTSSTGTITTDTEASTDTVTVEKKTYTDTEVKYVNYNIAYLYAKSDTTNTMSYDDYKTFLETCSFDALTYDRSDFISAQLAGIYDTYNQNVEIINKYETFTEMLARGDNQDDDTSKKEVLYRQCMITNEGEDSECWSRKYGDDKTSLTVVQVYAYSRIYTVTEDYSPSVHQLTDADAHEIITKLQAYCGPYSNEVIANMMKIMCATAKYEGVNDPTSTVISDDKRVMPYDTTSLLARDRTNYSVTDPRVELYKSHIIGKLISKFELNPLAIGIFIKPQKTIISIAGKVTELSVFMQQICNFDVLDGYGLSPANLWVSGYVAFMLGFLALFFVVKTVVAIIKMGTNSGSKIIVAFIILFIELGLIAATFANPTRVWNTVKNIENKLINLGEMTTVYSYPELVYLYGSSSNMEVTYYMPYLDTWSKYNTGYGILEDEQLIDSSADYRELVDKAFPTIDGTEVKHWSVLLMDSFSYWGYSNALENTVTVDGKTYNGNVINNNAYRVVDHFMAPRVTLNDSGDKIKMNMTQNENYNGQFQSGVIDLIVKLLNCFLCCLLSVIKLMTFLWQWFVLYIFIFRVILGKTAENKSMGRIVLETFAPTISMIILGLYSGMVMILGMNASGLIGIFLEIFLFWLTFMIVRWWHDTNIAFFPNTLIWLYYITNMSRANQRIQQDRIRNRAKNEDIENGMEEGYSEANIDEQREMLFDENGNLRSRYRDAKYNTQVVNWYNRAKALEGPGYNVLHTEETRRQMRNLEASEKFRDLLQQSKINGSSALTNNDKIGHNDEPIDRSSVDQTADVKDYTYRHRIGRKQKADDSDNEAKPKDNSDSVSNMYKDDSEKDDNGRTKTGSGQEKKNNRPKKIGHKDD